MNVSVILAHPVPGSLNHAIAAEAVAALREAGHTVTYHDLYLEGFDPLLPGEEIPTHAKLPERLDAYCREVASTEVS